MGVRVMVVHVGKCARSVDGCVGRRTRSVDGCKM